MSNVTINTKNNETIVLRTIDNITAEQMNAVRRDAFKIRAGMVLMECTYPNGAKTLNSWTNKPMKYVGCTFRSIAINPKAVDMEVRCFGPLGSIHKHDGSAIVEFENALDEEQKVIEKVAEEAVVETKPTVADDTRCTATTRNGKRCTKNVHKNGLCHIHYREAVELKQAEEMALSAEREAIDAAAEDAALWSK